MNQTNSSRNPNRPMHGHPWTGQPIQTAVGMQLAALRIHRDHLAAWWNATVEELRRLGDPNPDGDEDSEAMDQAVEAAVAGLPDGSCSECGCTDLDCSQCVEATGEPCTWVVVPTAKSMWLGLCSRCDAERAAVDEEVIEPAELVADPALVASVAGGLVGGLDNPDADARAAKRRGRGHRFLASPQSLRAARVLELAGEPVKYGTILKQAGLDNNEGYRHVRQHSWFANDGKGVYEFAPGGRQAYLEAVAAIEREASS